MEDKKADLMVGCWVARLAVHSDVHWGMNWADMKVVYSEQLMADSWVSLKVDHWADNSVYLKVDQLVYWRAASWVA